VRECGQISGSAGGVGSALGLKRRGDGILRWVDLGWHLELQHLPYSGGVAALNGM
jgi:hypothetical protein